MTYEITCKNCGTVIYSGFDLRSPEDILRPVDYKCKKCGTKLDIKRFTIEIKKMDGTFV